jgi:hypothetical protein
MKEFDSVSSEQENVMDQPESPPSWLTPRFWVLDIRFKALK